MLAKARREISGPSCFSARSHGRSAFAKRFRSFEMADPSKLRSMQLDLSPLEQVIVRLREGVRRYKGDVSDNQIRDGLIQRFEFTHGPR